MSLLASEKAATNSGLPIFEAALALLIATNATIKSEKKRVFIGLVFSKNYLIGSGVKSFIYECVKIPSDTKNISCNNHPHNIYLEIFVNLGIIGMLIFIIFLFSFQ